MKLKFAVTKRAASLVFALTVCTAQPAQSAVINELFWNPTGTDSGAGFGNEYVELRGTSLESLAGGYLIFLESDSGGTLGQIQDIFDLTSQSLGINGFLTLRQKGSTYTVAAGTNDLVNAGTGNGFGSGASSSIGHQGQSGQIDIENLSFTALLINIGGGAAPTLGQDLDASDDGLDALPLGWSILDGISVLDGGSTDRGYASIVFSHDADGLFEGSATFVNMNFTEAEYAMRLGNSTGSAPGDWFVADLSGSSGVADDTHTVDPDATAPFFEGQVITNHLGAANPVPEPSTWILAIGALVGLAALRQISGGGNLAR